MDKRTEERILDAKTRARPGSIDKIVIVDTFFTELKGDEGWKKFNYSGAFSLAKETVKDNCPRISCAEVSEQMFIDRYERPGHPVVITDSQLEWQATYKWTVDVIIIYENYYIYMF